MSGLNLLVVSERYWPDGSGGELATYLLVNALRSKFNVVVITGSKNFSRISGVRYVYESLLARQEKAVLWLNIMRLVKTQRFRDLLHKSDVVYVPRIAYPVIPYAKKTGKKVVVHLHSYAPISYTAAILAPYEKHRHQITRDDVFLVCMKGVKYCPRVLLLWWLPKHARKWVLQADKVICVSRRQTEIITDQIPELRGKIEVVYNPLPSRLVVDELRKELDDTPTFLYVGGESYVKGFHILLQALKQIGKQGIKVRFLLTNKYGLRSLEVLKQLCERYRNLDIQVMGRVKYDELLNLYRRAWALVFPSIWEEPLPYAVVEASVSGVLPIASKVGGVSELLSGTIASRFMFTPGMFTELVEKLMNISSLSIDEVKSLGSKLRRNILVKLNPREIEEKIIQIFNRVVSNF